MTVSGSIRSRRKVSQHTRSPTTFLIDHNAQNKQAAKDNTPRRLTGKQQPPNREPVLRETCLAVIEQLGANLVIGGKSVGRIVSLVAEKADVMGLVCAGCRSHHVGQPERPGRWNALGSKGKMPRAVHLSIRKQMQDVANTHGPCTPALEHQRAQAFNSPPTHQGNPNALERSRAGEPRKRETTPG